MCVCVWAAHTCKAEQKYTTQWELTAAPKCHSILAVIRSEFCLILILILRLSLAVCRVNLPPFSPPAFSLSSPLSCIHTHADSRTVGKDVGSWQSVWLFVFWPRLSPLLLVATTLRTSLPIPPSATHLELPLDLVLHEVLVFHSFSLSHTQTEKHAMPSERERERERESNPGTHINLAHCFCCFYFNTPHATPYTHTYPLYL